MSSLHNMAENNFQGNITTAEIRSKLHDRLESVLYYILPKGKVRNHQFIIGNIHGDTGESLRIELAGDKIGLWQDFATGDGGDIIRLWSKVRRIDDKTDFPKLVEDIKNWLGVYTPFQDSIKSVGSSANQIANNDNLGKPTAVWSYLDEQNKLIAKVLRYDTENGKKYLPWDEKLKSYRMSNPRPLYNIPGIVKADRVILVEGEKCAQSIIDQDICATTSMGGANADIKKTDWTPLKGKDVIIWPDNDAPGKSYAKSAYEKLMKIGAKSVNIIDIPEDKPDKWDAADAIEEGVNVAEFIELAKFINMKVNDNNYIEHILGKDLIGTPPTMEWLIPDWLPKGEVGAIYGDGGLGKSLLVQQLMTALATGKGWLGFEGQPMRVYGVLCEDKKDELHRRQFRINQKLGICDSELENMLLVSRVGKNNILMKFDKEDQGKLTEFFDKLLIDIKKFQPKLVVLDTLADLFGGNENIRAQARLFIQSCCGKIAAETGATVLLCAHPSEAGLSKKSGTGGSTAWHNSLRFRWFIEKAEGIEFTQEMRILTLKKSNYSPCDGKFILRLERDGIFMLVDDLKILSAAERYSNKLEDLRDAKGNYILNLIHDEASAGRAYTICSFSRVFQNTGKPNLGSQRTLSDRLKDLAHIGYIRFFQNGEDYGLSKLANGNFGYMCASNMKLKIKDKGLVVIKPTHYICKLSGNLEKEKSN